MDWNILQIYHIQCSPATDDVIIGTHYYNQHLFTTLLILKILIAVHLDMYNLCLLLNITESLRPLHFCSWSWTLMRILKVHATNLLNILYGITNNRHYKPPVFPRLLYWPNCLHCRGPVCRDPFNCRIILKRLQAVVPLYGRNETTWKDAVLWRGHTRLYHDCATIITTGNQNQREQYTKRSLFRQKSTEHRALFISRD